ncbi:MAG: diguanylate cyclase [Clostridium sp.]
MKLHGKWKEKQHSIAFQYTVFITFIIFLQSILLIGALIAGGALRESKENVYKTFDATVASRTKYLQNEMDNRWTRIEPYVEIVSEKVTNLGIYSSVTETEDFLLDISDTLISMLRVSGATGSFFITDSELKTGNHAALYFRDYTPTGNYANNQDLYMVMGSPNLVKKLRIPTDSTWHCGFVPRQDNSDFYMKPYQAATEFPDGKELGYWSKPFVLSEGEQPVITYSVPIFDGNNQLRGIMGVEISTSYIKELLPAEELAPRDFHGYMLALKKENSDALVPLLFEGEDKNALFKDAKELQLHLYDANHSIYRLSVDGQKTDVYGCVQPIKQYQKNVPYDSEPWMMVGLLEGKTLFDFVTHLQHIFILAFLTSLILGIITGVVINRRITAPFVELADEVRYSDYTKKIALKKTGLTELDELSKAIEISNHNLIDSTLRMSEIMDLLKIPIGAFEYKTGADKVQVTNGVFDVLNLTREEANSLLVDQTVFWDRIEEIKKRPEGEEAGVYLIQESPEQWVKIAMATHDQDCLGAVRNVTDEIREKHQIKRERDYDFLTKIYNRGAFQREIQQLLLSEQLKVTALVMLDLDGLKQVNDTMGHGYGDCYIKETAVRLSELAEDGAIVGRRSGDEFYAFFYGYDHADEIREIIRRFYKKLRTNDLIFSDGTRVYIRISAGISWYGVDAFSYDELVQHADYAMYAVKRTTKDGFGEFEQKDYINE